jgi:hypothetical protein
MNPHLKLAYDHGVQRALEDAGLIKESNLNEILDHMAEGASKEEAWAKAYPNQPVPENLAEILREYKDTTEKDANVAWQQTLQNQGQHQAASQMPGYSQGGPVKKDGYLTDKKLNPYARVHKGERVVPEDRSKAANLVQQALQEAGIFKLSKDKKKKKGPPPEGTTFLPWYDDDERLVGEQKNLPDKLQKEILKSAAKKKNQKWVKGS